MAAAGEMSFEGRLKILLSTRNEKVLASVASYRGTVTSFDIIPTLPKTTDREQWVIAAEEDRVS